ncbi:hypothetical protein M427DRAFT_138888 [Gonapodya prolifera JEL478]|uniref:Uncharacterized protein n=1 Tax=Gonapodya prolifera (strain JEL478) TaxID=1344416 RepID=A0A139A2E0_GONPJ|nr:hypothetical protein M427DRAFT_138888 [Gonapodya prolifera JEL478]|eukprot:KXS10808.1 hypothetical protein M427DRAFT_138888 [Gonapodya prolifera JEL478]
MDTDAATSDGTNRQRATDTTTSTTIPPFLHFLRTRLAPLAIRSYPDAYRDFKRLLAHALLTSTSARARGGREQDGGAGTPGTAGMAGEAGTAGTEDTASLKSLVERRESLARDVHAALATWVGVGGAEAGGRLGVLLRYLCLTHNTHSFLRGITSPIQPACDALLLPDPLETPPSPADSLARLVLSTSGVEPAQSGMESDAASVAQQTGATRQAAGAVVAAAGRKLRAWEVARGEGGSGAGAGAGAGAGRGIGTGTAGADATRRAHALLQRTCTNPLTSQPLSRAQIAMRDAVAGVGIGWAALDGAAVRYATWRGLIGGGGGGAMLADLMAPIRAARAHTTPTAAVAAPRTVSGGVWDTVTRHSRARGVVIPGEVEFAVRRCEVLECLARARMVEVSGGGEVVGSWTQKAFEVWRGGLAPLTLTQPALLPAHKDTGALLVYAYAPPDPSSPLSDADTATLSRHLTLILDMLTFLASSVIFPLLNPPKVDPGGGPFAADNALSTLLGELVRTYDAHVRFQGDDPASASLPGVAMGVGSVCRAAKVMARFVSGTEGWAVFVAELAGGHKSGAAAGVGGAMDTRGGKKDGKGWLEEELVEDLVERDARRLGIDEASISQLTEIMACSRVDAVAMLVEHGGDLGAVLAEMCG